MIPTQQAWTLVAGLLVASAVTSQVPTPLGDDFLVNSHTTDLQSGPSVIATDAGDYLFVWSSYSLPGDADGEGIAVRLFSGAAPLAGDALVNVWTTGFQNRPVALAHDDGTFTLFWNSPSSPLPGSDDEIRSRDLDAAGQPLGAETSVNGYVTGRQVNPAVARDASGAFVVVWHDYSGRDGDGAGIFGRRFNSDGSAAGGDFQINEYTTQFQTFADVGMTPDGDFVVVWQSRGADGDLDGIAGRRFASDGSPTTGELLLNAYTTSSQTRPRLDISEGGGFVVAWKSNDQDGDSGSIVGRRFTGAGNAAGGEFQINQYTTASQGNPDIAIVSRRSFVVVWDSRDQEGEPFRTGVFGRRFWTDGASTDEFPVNSYTTDDQDFPRIAAAPGGDFIVTWIGQQGSSDDVYARPFHAVLFEDGFESGDTSFWSSQTP